MIYEHLFSPITINGVVLKNRIVAAPTGDYFGEKAKGGAGMVVAGHAIVEPGFSSFASADEPYIFSKYRYEDTRRRVLEIHQGGAKASIELFHGGQDARVKTFAKGPCTLKRPDGTQVVAMDELMMQETLDWYYRTAQEAKAIGFDMVLLHFGHGWLPAQFLSPYFNHRTDEYGGSIERRAKFPLRILETVRRAVGPRYPVDMRISANEFVPNSIDFADVKAFATMAEPFIDTVHVSAGMDMNRQANVHTVTTNLEPYMPNLAWARAIKEIVAIPVGVVGAIETPEAADGIIAEGAADMVAFGRAFIADPYWPRKAMAGHVDDISPCVRCVYCYHIATNHKNVACTVNPRYNHEGFIPATVPPTAYPRKVVVVGGGPAGIEAASTAAQAGHQVVLFEKNPALGGLMQHIQYEHFKDEIRLLLAHMIAKITKSNVDIRLNTQATPQLVAAEQPDVVIVAVGAQESVPPIPGIHGPDIMTGIQAIGREQNLGQNIVILGGGTVGTELALGLSLNDHKRVTVVEMGDTLAPQANSLYKIAINQKIETATSLQILLNTTCTNIGNHEVAIRHADGEGNGTERTLPFDNLIVATGMRANADVAGQFFGIAPDTNQIGDCVKPRLIMDAIFEGRSLAMSL